MKKSLLSSGPVAASSQPALADDQVPFPSRGPVRDWASGPRPGRYRVLAGVACLWTLLLVAGGHARADPMAAAPSFTDWSYTLDITPQSNFSGAVGSVNFALAPGGDGSQATIPVAGVTTIFSSTSTASPDFFKNVGFSLIVHLTDNPSGKSGDATFQGKLLG